MEATVVAPAASRQPAVSIHASVMEATRPQIEVLDMITVSIHASVMEATRGNDERHDRGTVSIHASVMEATTTSLALPGVMAFRSTPP